MKIVHNSHSKFVCFFGDNIPLIRSSSIEHQWICICVYGHDALALCTTIYTNQSYLLRHSHQFNITIRYGHTMKIDKLFYGLFIIFIQFYLRFMLLLFECIYYSKNNWTNEIWQTAFVITIVKCKRDRDKF